MKNVKLGQIENKKMNKSLSRREYQNNKLTKLMTNNNNVAAEMESLAIVQSLPMSKIRNLDPPDARALPISPSIVVPRTPVSGDE
jgi:hypothetical protein